MVGKAPAQGRDAFLSRYMPDYAIFTGNHFGYIYGKPLWLYLRETTLAIFTGNHFGEVAISFIGLSVLQGIGDKYP